jgi:AcrR family transcriptional regulator
MRTSGAVASSESAGESSGTRGCPGVERGSLASLHRAAILDAMVELVAERGYAEVSLKLLLGRAEVSRRVFYGAFPSMEDCFMGILDQGMRLMAEVMARAFARESFWLDGLLSAEAAVLMRLDGDPQLARVLLVEALGAGAWALERRERNVRALLEQIVVQWKHELSQGDFRPLAASSVMCSILGILQDHLVRREPAPLISLLGPLMGVITGPYLDPESVAREVAHGEALAQEIMGRALPAAGRVEHERWWWSTPPGARAKSWTRGRKRRSRSTTTRVRGARRRGP